MDNIINVNFKNVNSNEINTNLHKEDNQEYVTSSNIALSDTGEDINSCFGHIEKREYGYHRLSLGKKQISNFTLELKAMLENENGQILQCELENDIQEYLEIYFEMKDFLSVGNFKKALYSKNIKLIFSGNIDDLDDIRGLLFKGRYEKILGKSKIGIYKFSNEFIFVGNEETIDKSGDKISNVKYTDLGYIKSRITKNSVISNVELCELSKYLFNFNELGITTSILGYCTSCFLRERLYIDNNIKGSHLMICGEAGSGKSETLENIIMPFFDTKSKMSADQCTRFVNVKYAGSSNTIPFIIEEYKPTRLGKTRKDEISALIRNGYDRTPGYRGTVEQKLNEYPVITPIILVGEMAIEESAGLERSVLVYFSKYKSNINGRGDSYKYLKENKHLIKKFGRALLQEALNIEEEELTKRYVKLEGKYSYLPGRVKNNVVVSMLGILLIKDVFERNGLNFEDSTGYTVDNVLDAIKSNVVDTILEGNTVVKGIIEKDIEVLNDMVETGELVKGIDYQMVNSETELAINVKMLYPKLLKYINSHNLKEIDKLSQNEFTKQLRLKEYYKDYKAIRFIHNLEPKNAKAFVLDMQKLASKVTADNFYM